LDVSFNSIFEYRPSCFKLVRHVLNVIRVMLPACCRPDQLARRISPCHSPPSSHQSHHGTNHQVFFHGLLNIGESGIGSEMNAEITHFLCPCDIITWGGLVRTPWGASNVHAALSQSNPILQQHDFFKINRLDMSNHSSCSSRVCKKFSSFVCEYLTRTSRCWSLTVNYELLY